MKSRIGNDAITIGGLQWQCTFYSRTSVADNFAVCPAACLCLLEMSCLMSAMDDSSIRLHSDCVKQLKQRIQLWNAAVKVSPLIVTVMTA